MEERWIRNLLVTRKLLAQATISDDGTEPGAMATIILADLAVETVAKTARAYRPPSSYPGDGYLLTDSARRTRGGRDPSLPTVLDDVLASWREARADEALSSVEISEAMRLREQRNLVQHDAMVPADVARGVARAESFARWVVAEVFGLGLEEVSRALLIRDEEARGRLLLAEQAAETGDYRIALAQLRVAFEQAIRSRREWHSDWTFIDSEIKTAVKRATGTEYGQAPSNVSPGGLMEVMNKIARRLEEVDEVVQALAIGADPVESEWFLRTAPVSRMSLGTAPHWTIHDDDPRSREDYLRGYEFVTSTLVRWQQLPPAEDRRRRPFRPATETVLENPPEAADAGAEEAGDDPS